MGNTHGILNMLTPIPDLAVQVERWNGEREIKLPVDTQFGEDLGLLIDVVRIDNMVDGWENLIPKYYQRMLDYIYLADFLSAQCVLDALARFLGTQASKIDGSNPRGVVHQRVRNAYRMAKYIQKRQRAAAENCQLCHLSLIPKPPSLPSTYKLPCCNSFIHLSCRANWTKCPVCDIAFTTIMCCVCLEEIKPASDNYLDSWIEQKQYRTPCCYCDMHKECVPNFPRCATGFQGLVAVCPLCSCAITDEGGLRTELWEAVDFIFQRRQQQKNEEWRRNVANSLQPLL